MASVQNQGELVSRPDESERERDDDEAPDDLVEPDYLVDDGDQGGDERALRLEIPMAATPIHLRIERNEGVFVEVARHGGGVELPPGMRIHKRGGEMKQAKGGAERQDQQECRTVASRRGPLGPDGVINFGSLDVRDPL